MNSKKICLFLRQLRLDMNLTQDELANKLYVDRSVISRIENGKMPSSELLYNYSKFFDVTIDEIIYGEVKNAENEKEINNVGKILYDDRYKIAKKLRISILVLLLLMLAYLFTFFILFFNSIKIYSLSVDSSEIEFENGLFIQTREKVHFQLNNISSNKKINKINIIYKNGNKMEYILSSDNTNLIQFDDYYGYEEYINFSEINEMIKHMYVLVEFSDLTQREIHINFDRNYTNNKLFLQKNKSIANNKKVKKETSNDILELLIDNSKSKSQHEFFIKLGKSKYKLFVLDNTISLGGKDFEINIQIMTEKIFEYNDIKDKEIKLKYSYNISQDRCIYGSCDTFAKDIELLKNVLNQL